MTRPTAHDGGPRANATRGAVNEAAMYIYIYIYMYIYMCIYMCVYIGLERMPHVAPSTRQQCTLGSGLGGRFWGEGEEEGDGEG